MRLTFVLLVLTIVSFLTLFVVSSLEMSLAAGLRSVVSTWWGITTLADLGVGLIFVSVWIALIERGMRAIPWIIAMFLLGNFTLLVYLAWRARRVGSVRELVLAQPAPNADTR